MKSRIRSALLCLFMIAPFAQADFAPRQDPYQGVKPISTGFKVFRGFRHNKGCLVMLRYESFSDGNMKVTAKVRGSVVAYDSGNAYWREVSVADDFALDKNDGLYSTFLPEYLLMRAGDSQSLTGWVDNTLGYDKYSAKFTPSVDAPTSVTIKHTDSFLQVLGGWHWFQCDNLVQMSNEDSAPYTKANFYF
jgi:hypothetical protein